jgi:hypothetical protein
MRVHLDTHNSPGIHTGVPICSGFESHAFILCPKPTWKTNKHHKMNPEQFIDAAAEVVDLHLAEGIKELKAELIKVRSGGVAFT